MKVYQYPGGRTVRAGAGALGRTLALLGALLAAAVLCLVLTGCGAVEGPEAAVPADGAAESGAAGSSENGDGAAEQYAVPLPEGVLAAGDPASEAVYRIALCGDAEDPLAEETAARFRARLDEIGRERHVLFALAVEYAEGGKSERSAVKAASEAAALAAARLPDGDADLLAGIGTAAALAMRETADRLGKPAESADVDTGMDGAQPESGPLPVVFTGWQSSPSPSAESAEAKQFAETVEELDAADNVSGLTVSWNSEALVNVLMTLQPAARKVGILYNPQDKASAAAVSSAVALFQEHGIELVERTGSTADEIQIAAQALAADEVEVVYTPDDSAVLAAEGVVSRVLSEVRIPHYAASAAFARAGAFLGYGAEPSTLGRELADLAASILLDGSGAGDVRAVEPAAVLSGRTCAILGRDSAAILEILNRQVPALALPRT